MPVCICPCLADLQGLTPMADIRAEPEGPLQEQPLNNEIYAFSNNLKKSGPSEEHTTQLAHQCT
eukprot:2418685-Karenia_brevis.AAC.1